MTDPAFQSNPLGDPGGNPPEPVQLPIDGVLDLHAFPPRQVNEIVTDYLAACRQQNLPWVRIIHGKGIGVLRRTVHTLLSRHPDVVSFGLDHTLFSGDGATVVRLRTDPSPHPVMPP
jgi:DNA-nicking Smr family endonuclease